MRQLLFALVRDIMGAGALREVAQYLRAGMGVGDGRLSPALPSAFMSRSVTFRDKKTGLPVTDRDERLGAAGLSKSVTFGGLENV